MSGYEQIGRSIVKRGTLAAIVTFDKEATDQEVREFNRYIRSGQALLTAIEQISGQLHNIENVADIDSVKRLAVGARDIAREAKDAVNGVKGDAA